MIVTHLRPWRVLAPLLAAAVLLAACAGGGSPADGAAAPAPGNAAFPVTVEHTLGSTVVPAEPRRVVSLGYTDQDALLALGVVPVAIREFTGNRPFATWPWAADHLQDGQPQVLGAEIDPETIAALRPDLIVAVSAGLDAEQYATFSRIAPTITQPVGFPAYQAPWQDATRLIGTAVGRTAQAEQMVTDLDARFAAVRAQYPQFAGKRAALAAVSSTGTGSYFVWNSKDNRGRFLGSLGFTVPARFDELAGQNFYAEISTEQLGLLDENDLVGWITIPGTSTSGLEQQPGYPALRVGQEGGVVDLTEEQGVALSFSSVLSLPMLLDDLPGEFAAHLGG
ncbi:iron-siderophore ABC transporter substrate-binding protein [Pseudonocardia xinjiangensis]|uniref:Iron-siderophore ABC transporter substrate-binding protein n=1 Tax=Pseudonocardia xinjiangensis TaxID=75289 RepID=A0ABX1RDL0_9PSEU|nr:iron-siderophore ABC transporter substrate-binding protein [Pseudonocardia xinjiangensis]NMH78481.1 iron-siderophore ABC transporter substrate-binding protein [Pseudonocardia xinjiangensis]